MTIINSYLSLSLVNFTFAFKDLPWSLSLSSKGSPNTVWAPTQGRQPNACSSLRAAGVRRREAQPSRPRSRAPAAWNRAHVQKQTQLLLNTTLHIEHQDTVQARCRNSTHCCAEERDSSNTPYWMKEQADQEQALKASTPLDMWPHNAHYSYFQAVMAHITHLLLYLLENKTKKVL